MNTAIFTMHLDDEPFAKIKNNQKTIELRLYDEKRKNIKLGDFISFIDPNENIINVKVIGLYIFPSFADLLQRLPHSKVGDYTASDMQNYYALDDQIKHGVIGIEFEKQ